MIISISGSPGSGKSTITKKLAKKLNWPHYNMGKLWRMQAKEKGITLAEFHRYSENNAEMDLAIDEYQKKLGKSRDDFIVEGRTSWYMIPHSIKLFLDVGEKEGAKRVFKELQKQNSRNEDVNLQTATDVLASHRRRKQSDSKRYRQYYNIHDVFNADNYDFILDTTGLSIEQIFDKVYAYIQKKIRANRS